MAESIKQLIEAVFEYAQEFFWNDADAINALENMGINELDFIEAGYGDFVYSYYHDDEE